MTEHPRIIIPEDKKIHALKFVQLYTGKEIDEPFMRFQDGTGYDWGDALEKVLKEFNLEYGFIQGSEGLPKLTGENYKAVGMGLAGRIGDEIIIFKNQGSLNIHYHLKFDPEHFERMKPHLPPEIKFTIREQCQKNQLC